MTYTEEVKSQIIRRYKSKESIISISNEIGIPRSTIYRWIKDYTVKNSIPQIAKSKEIKELERKVEKQQTMLTIIHKLGISINAPLKEKLNAMAPLYGKYNVHWLCEAMQVDRGTFYNHIFRNKKDNTWNSKRREILREEILKIYEENRQIFGAGKITAILKQKGYRASEETVSFFMHDMGLQSIRHRAKAIYEKEVKSKNKVNQQFQTSRPNEVWVSDVTYFRTQYNSYYVCVILDLYSRKVISYRIALNNSTQLVKSTFKDAYESRQPKEAIIFHSDRGGNYRSKTFCNYLKSLKVPQSFSRAYTPYDNSVVESFFSSLKREELYRTKYRSDKEFKKAVADYMIFYNTQRPHSNNNYRTPDAKEAEYYSNFST
ncbi:MAG: IS3 family transposase [Clostridia bacterium]|nr:IS3 family transposase [Clostridia bacterium]